MLNITEIRIKKINKGDLLAAASVCIDNCFILKEIKLLEGKHGRYISMPKRRIRNKELRQDFFYPLNNEIRVKLLDAISEKYDDVAYDGIIEEE